MILRVSWGDRPGPAVVVTLMLAAAMVVGGIAALVLTDGSVDREVGSRGSPALSFETNETADTVRVNETQENVTWRGFQIMMDKVGSFQLVGDGNVTRGEALVFTSIENESTVASGDMIRFCTDKEGEELVVDLRYRATGSVVDTFHFMSVAACDAPEPEEGGVDESEIEPQGGNDDGSGDVHGADSENKTGDEDASGDAQGTD